MNDKFGLVCRLQKEISLIMGNHLATVINEIFKFPPYLGTFSQVNYLMKSLQATRIIQLKNDTFGLVSRLLERFRKLQEAIWLTVINKIFKFPPYFDPFGYVNYLYELSPGYPNYATQK